MKLTVELPDSAFSSLRQSPEDFSREMLTSACVKWYEMGRVSQAKAAEIAGLSRAEFVDALLRHGVPAIQSGPEELEAAISSP